MFKESNLWWEVVTNTIFWLQSLLTTKRAKYSSLESELSVLNYDEDVPIRVLRKKDGSSPVKSPTSPPGKSPAAHKLPSPKPHGGLNLNLAPVVPRVFFDTFPGKSDCPGFVS